MSWGVIGEAASSTAHAVSHAAKSVSHAVSNAAKDVGDEAGKITSAAGDEAKSMGAALSNAGEAAEQGVVDGAKWAGDTFEKGAEKVEEGAVALGKFASAHACSAGIGTALGAAIMELGADGEEEATMGALAIALQAAKKGGGIAAIQAASTLIANGLVEAIWAIPGVSGSNADKAEGASIIKYCIVMAAKQNMSKVVLSGGQYLTGVFLTVLTGFICSGELPGGYSVWKGAGSSMDFANN